MLVHLKDQTPLNHRAGVIYKAPCGDCPKVYVDKTGRTLSHRLKEHRRALTSRNLSQSAMEEHAAAHDHATNWGSAKVVDTHHQFQQRCLLESWHIRSKEAIREEGNLSWCTRNWLSRKVTETLPHDATAIELLSWAFHILACFHNYIILSFSFYFSLRFFSLTSLLYDVVQQIKRYYYTSAKSNVDAQCRLSFISILFSEWFDILYIQCYGLWSTQIKPLHNIIHINSSTVLNPVPQLLFTNLSNTNKFIIIHLYTTCMHE